MICSKGLSISMYNFDFMIRNILLNNEYCFISSNNQFLQSFDIKANQHDTLSYLFHSLPVELQIHESMNSAYQSSNHYFFEALKDSKESLA